jgi:anti-sigma B factor antagonist
LQLLDRTNGSDIAVATRTIGPRTVIDVAGEVDMATAPLVAGAIDDAIRSGSAELLIDLTRTSFMDSSGLNLLLQTRARLDALDGRLAIVCPQGCVRRAFDLAGLDRQLNLSS